MVIKGKDFPFNIKNARTMERVETQLELMSAPLDVSAFKHYSDALRAECRRVKTFFNNLFGEGAFESVVSDEDDYDECEALFIAVIDELKAARDEVQNKVKIYSVDRVTSSDNAK